MKFLSPEVTLYLYKSTIHPSMEYCFHVWTGAPSCYLESLDKLQKLICKLLVLRLLFLWKPWLILKMWPAYVFSIGITLVVVLQNWLNWFHFPFLERCLLIILIDCIIVLSPLLDVTRMSMWTFSFLAQLDSGILCP